MDEVTLLATITTFLVWGPDEIAQTPTIQTQCVVVFKDCWGSKNPEVSVQKVASGPSNLDEHSFDLIFTDYISIC